MDKLWAPWRVGYITKVIGKKKDPCVFCRILREKNDKENYIIKRTKHSLVVLNIYPYNNGHVLILPNRHVKDLKNLSRVEREELLDLIQEMQAKLDKLLKPAGYNIGLNLGRAAGAGIPGHLHFHVVPRWWGDNNFMPVVANTKVISQSLKELHKLLTK